MIRDPKDLKRYTASERANHWVVGICFILLALSGLAFFHPAFFPLTQLFGGPVWARILHPFIGILMAVSFLSIFLRFRKLNIMNSADIEWLKRAKEMVNGDDHNMPEQGKYNGGQKALFWVLAVGMLLMTVSGVLIWRAYFHFDITAVRLGAVVHAGVAAVMIALIFVHVYAAIWVKGTIRAMWYGTVTRAWAKQHHRAWYRQVTGK
ncbi:formate dehydrogenase subunit gamma [Uliginosibacterium sp. 31-16]|uniref:formate dehydrogenase subunit gamma n=1 Tax=Uliginosibacterium sp. 31-16 TaxID=3068315 RepID=UPI00273FDFB0|nr:formate dehydrogenase subunit gamma [Uliginosibacterium sp. 31-16]MDP5239851.1 formate dehydrogenase subunit gamma [Uliginosibacterium sp. 31-16]